jgi:hypothetical protein
MRDSTPPNSTATPTTRKRAVRSEGFDIPELIACTSAGARVTGAGFCTNAPAEVALFEMVASPIGCLRGDTKANPSTTETARITANTGAKRVPFMPNLTVSDSRAYYTTN